MQVGVRLSIRDNCSRELSAAYLDQLYGQFVATIPNAIGFTTTPDEDEFMFYFHDEPPENDVLTLIDIIKNFDPIFENTYTQSKTYTTGKLQIKNTSFTVLDKIIFKGTVPIKFSVNSYSSSSSGSYSVRFVNVATKEIMAEATFNNTGDEDVMEVGEYTTALPSETVVIEIQGKTNSSGNKAFIEGVVLDYN